MQYVSSTEHAYMEFQWDPRLISFLESLEYGRETVMNLLRGPVSLELEEVVSNHLTGKLESPHSKSTYTQEGVWLHNS